MSSRRLGWVGRVASGASGSRLLWSLGVTLGVTGCAEARRLDTHVSQLQAVTRQARERGAYRCAPQELAEAESQLEFAEHELREGDPPRAREHLTIARANAYAALRLSTPACEPTPTPAPAPAPAPRGSSASPQSYAPATVRSEPTMITAQLTFRRGSTKEHAAI